MTKDIIQNASLFSTDLHAGLDPTSTRMPNEPTSNFNIGTKLEFKILYKWNNFSFRLELLLLLHLEQQESKKDQPPKKKKRERKQKSLRHYGEMRKHKTP